MDECHNALKEVASESNKFGCWSRFQRCRSRGLGAFVGAGSKQSSAAQIRWDI